MHLKVLSLFINTAKPEEELSRKVAQWMEDWQKLDQCTLICVKMQLRE